MKKINISESIINTIMTKLYYYYGTVSAAKTMNLLASAHSYKNSGKNCLLIKPAIDTRSGRNIIGSRCGLSAEADIILESDDTNLMEMVEARNENIDIIFVDECQFLTTTQIDTLRLITNNLDISVMCYGLRTDFRNKLFDGSKRLFEVADIISEIKSVCNYCNRNASHNIRYLNGKSQSDGPTIQIGGDEIYKSVCYKHFVA
jgi:thymidine kinase